LLPSTLRVVENFFGGSAIHSIETRGTEEKLQKTGIE
jgi:hypothetical protein